MAIEKIGNVNNITGTSKVKLPPKGPRVSGEDAVVLSSEAKKMAEMESISQMVKSAPDVRAEKVRALREKIKKARNAAGSGSSDHKAWRSLA